MCVTLLTLFPGKTYEKDGRANKQSCAAEKQSAQKTRLKTKSRTRSRQLEVALRRTRYKMSTPQFRGGNPLAPEKGAFPLDHFGECATFKETYLKCLQVLYSCSLMFDVKTRWYYHALTRTKLFFFRALKMMTLYVNVKTETKIGREQVSDGIQIVPRMSHGERTDGEATAQRTRVYRRRSEVRNKLKPRK